MAPAIITLSKDAINNMDLSCLNEFVEWHKDNYKYFNMSAGTEHYKLLSYLSTVISCSKIIDIGTFLGFSAVALSFLPDKKVISYDIYDCISDNVKSAKNKANITLKIMNCLKDIDTIIDTSLVMIDIDHEGNNELDILNALRKANYKGLILLDDIYLNNEMKQLWNDIPEKKIDISEYGHYSGTGIVIMDASLFEIILA